MAVIVNEGFIKKAVDLKRPLKETEHFPVSTVKFAENEACFQNLEAVKEDNFSLPVILNPSESVTLDFGEHFVGYISLTLDHFPEKRITDSPVRLYFSFGEFPLEIMTPPEEYKGGLGSGWLQNEERSFVFLPARGTLDRRYSFRYLKIKRTDSGAFPVKITKIKVNAVSAVSLEDAPTYEASDERLKKIYDMSVKTLKECEQEVFEDGPKRDRRLWIGDLRLQALTDYRIFSNLDLIKRCIYLFAGATGEHKMVAPCIFPDSPPYVDEWTFCDYSLYFISCLYDYLLNTDDLALVTELYDTARAQADIVFSHINTEKGITDLRPFVDWCPDLDKSVAFFGIFIYTMKQLIFISERLKKDYSVIDSYIEAVKTALLKFLDKDKMLFITSSGQISVHSNVWAVLSSVLTEEENLLILDNIKKIDTPFTMRTPYMRHFYIEALYNNGLFAEALEFIKEYWGKIADAGFDCCPEVFNPENEFESPYRAPEINSACHAWSCTPAYWIPILTDKINSI